MEILLTGPKTQAKVSIQSGDYAWREGQLYILPLIANS